ncbi:hypothetical protein C8Q78DRAFT_1073714 [Trametes maxima]|nr:hypothetical protein C8Q78DRAFT_1073714 [Trametes maxima]
MDQQVSELARTRLATTLGPTFLGFAGTCMLYGITSLQTWMYFNYDFKDEHPLRGSLNTRVHTQVLLLWFLDTLHMSFLTASMYQYVVVDFGNIPAMLAPNWTLAAMIIVVLVTNLIVRAIFGMRIWRLSGGHWLMPVFVVNVLSLFVLADGTYFAVKGLSVRVLVEVHHFSWSFYAGLGAEVVADAIVAASQCLLLVRMRTGLHRTDSLIALMMRYSINTGLLTSICAALILVTFTAQPETFIYFAFYFIYSKLYVNSLLATLNARRTRVLHRETARGGPHVIVDSDLQSVPSQSITDMEFKSRDMRNACQSAQLTTVIDLGPPLTGSNAHNMV